MKTESLIQQEIIKFFRNTYCLRHHSPRCVIFSVPNESKSKIETMVKMSMGMLPGVSDLIVVIPNAVFFVEVKKPGEKPRTNQAEFGNTVQDLGFQYIVVTSVDEFSAFFKEKLI